MSLAVVLFIVWGVAGVVAAVVFACACVCGARDDRLAEAWSAERERATAALNNGWRNGAA